MRWSLYETVKGPKSAVTKNDKYSDQNMHKYLLQIMIIIPISIVYRPQM